MKEVKLYLSNAGYCFAKASHAIKGANADDIRFPALFGLIKHPEKGWLLFDTGYTERFYESTKNWPQKFYALITKVQISKDEEVASQLLKFGLTSSDIKGIILSHFHADHIGGLNDFPNAILYCSRAAYQHTKRFANYWGFTKGLLRALLPEDLNSRVLFFEDIGKLKKDEVFDQKIDLFDDDTIMVYNLPGHACGQIGVLLQTNSNTYFLLADAAWTYKAYALDMLPHPVVRTFFHSWTSYKNTIAKIKLFHIQFPHVILIPSHCEETTLKYITKPNQLIEV